MGWWSDFRRRRAERRTEESTALMRQRELLDNLVHAIHDGNTLQKLRMLETAHPRLEPRFRRQAWDAIVDLMEKALADDCLTEEEEQALVRTVEATGIPMHEVAEREPGLFTKLIISRVNDGRIPVVEAPIMLKSGEVAHQVMEAALLKEVTIREYRGGYKGTSFRVAKGVRYHMGSSRGRSVVVGKELQADDAGTLVITSHRAVFTGQKRSIEFAYPKLISVETDGNLVRLHCSNRKNTPTLLASSGHVAAAIVNAAAQRLL